MEKRNYPTYLSENEVARMTGFSLSTLRNWRFRREGLPWVKVGRCVRYNLEDVVGFMESCKVDPQEIRLEATSDER